LALHPRELIERCIRADRDARSEFVSRFHRNIASIIVKIACRYQAGKQDLVQDLIQDVYLRIFSADCKVLRTLRSHEESAIAGLVQAIAYSVACDHFRSGATLKRGGAKPVISLEDSATGEGAQTGHEAERVLRSVLFAQIDRALKDVVGQSNPGEQRSVFWLYFRHGFTARDISALPFCKLSAKGVESLLLRLTKGVRDRLAGRGVGGAEGKPPSIPSERTGAC
jgi:RNA polymerase sigma-70 factor (ECF subfamily)